LANRGYPSEKSISAIFRASTYLDGFTMHVHKVFKQDGIASIQI